ncbi:MAG: hypothetical protein KDA50_02440 [Rhodobacteraceae bacterium]|nr:hypothetical protein [Paracoccaceae bacterium]
MPEAPSDLYLARQTYRRRRIRDGSRLLPVFGTFLFMLPLLWENGSDGGAMTLAQKTIYLFLVWFLLAGAAAVLARWHKAAELAAEEGKDGAPQPVQED